MVLFKKKTWHVIFFFFFILILLHFKHKFCTFQISKMMKKRFFTFSILFQKKKFFRQSMHRHVLRHQDLIAAIFFSSIEPNKTNEYFGIKNMGSDPQVFS